MGEEFFSGADEFRGHASGFNLTPDVNHEEALGAQLAADIAQQQLQKPPSSPPGPTPRVASPHSTRSGRTYQPLALQGPSIVIQPPPAADPSAGPLQPPPPAGPPAGPSQHPPPAYPVNQVSAPD